MSETEPKRKTLRARLTGWLKGETTPGVDPDVVRDMAKLLEETGLSEIEVERGGVRVRVAKKENGHVAPTQAAPAQTAVMHKPAIHAEEKKAETPPAKCGTPVTSPMVGTVYLAPQPGAPAFVQKGSMVREGDTVCIIEAMKTMNPVTAPVSGRIGDIAVSDAQPVEFGQPIMSIE
jgi:acetyl-CoA carboxylase biotin carboxyl carrier protein